VNADEVKKYIYDKSAKLSQQFIDFIKMKEFLIIYYHHLIIIVVIDVIGT